MRNPAGVRRDFEALEQRRLEAARLLEQGYSQSEVTRRLKAHRQSVSQWARQLQQGGRRALKKAGRAGRKPRLRPEDLRRIERGLQRGPQALGYETHLWTCSRVAYLIEHERGVEYDPSQAWRILRHLVGVASARRWKTLSAMAGVTWWNFYFRLFPGSIRSLQVVELAIAVVWSGTSCASSEGASGWSSCPPTLPN